MSRNDDNEARKLPRLPDPGDWSQSRQYQGRRNQPEPPRPAQSRTPSREVKRGVVYTLTRSWTWCLGMLAVALLFNAIWVAMYVGYRGHTVRPEGWGLIAGVLGTLVLMIIAGAVLHFESKIRAIAAFLAVVLAALYIVYGFGLHPR